ncbi:MAG: hypothetical protein NZ521_08315, partial [Flammeovirgaceae bacterium]|nr:hypothetical protein [Flammeovirgaceae bacterium]
IGIVNRDMQIIVEDCKNQRPRVLVPRDTCIVAKPLGTTLLDTIRAVDPDRHYVQLTWSNRDLINLTENRTFFTTFDTFALQPPFGKAQGLFTFTVFCNDVRREPYLFTFRAEDFPEYGKARIPPPRDDGSNPRVTHNNSGNGHLVDLQTWSVRVVGPAPENLQSTADRLNATVRLNWNTYSCPNAEKMIILRREGNLNFTPTACKPIPDGYEIVGEVPIGTTTFVDNNNGRGLKRGVTYCYRIYAAFPSPKFGESLASAEVCETIPSIAPYLTNVTVDETSRTTGKITVRWTKPIDIDLTAFPRPHTYRLARATGFSGNNQYIRFNTIFAENDTVFQDTNLNTEELVYNYRILFYSNNVLVDSSATASSVRLSVSSQPTSIVLTWQAETPWSNRNSDFPYHYVYRNNPNNPTTFTLLDSVSVTTQGFRYEDKRQLLPDSTYCYYVITSGTYGNPKIREPLLNWSQRICAMLKDTLFPCPPTDFNVVNQGLDCNQLPEAQPCPTSFENLLKWKPFIPQNPAVACDKDIRRYEVYYSPRFAERFDSLRFLTSTTDTFFLHRNLTSVAGCYAIRVLDRNGNASPPSKIFCLDNCPSYRLPNVFTPNGD